MHKIMVITTCDECKDVWLYLGVDGYCKRKNCIAIPEEKIPDWCPRINATQDMISFENS
jgi:hypothetical protein